MFTDINLWLTPSPGLFLVLTGVLCFFASFIFLIKTLRDNAYGDPQITTTPDKTQQERIPPTHTESDIQERTEYEAYVSDDYTENQQISKELFIDKTHHSEINFANDRIKLMFDTAPLIIEYWDKDFNLIDYNKTAAVFNNISPKHSIIPLDSIEFSLEFQPDGTLTRELWKSYLNRTFEQGFSKFEFVLQKGKRPIHLEVIARRMEVNGEHVIVTYTNDVSAIKEMLQEKELKILAEESSHAKTMFIANMSHEIRTPMNSILGYSELALNDVIPDTTREYLKIIVTNSNWLLNIVNDVLDLSKIESGQLDLEEIPFDIGDLMEQCQFLLLPAANEKQIPLNFNIAPLTRQNTFLLGDPTKLSQICINILSNAIKFTNNGAVVVSVTMVDSVKNSNSDTCLLNFDFTDAGIGMTEDQISRIFKPFTQADSSTTRKYGGTGLGLTITRRLIEAMGGELRVESAIGIGSKFSFTLPFKMVAADTISTEVLIEKPYFENGEVLVVDDNDMNLGVACEYLKRVGLKSTTAMTGKEAVDIVKKRMDANEKPYDLIFMDVHMPVMDGREAASIIRDFNLGTPIVAMTADTVALTKSATYEEFGIDDFLSKPFTTQDLWRCLLKYLTPSDAPATRQESTTTDEVLQQKLKYQFVKRNQDTFDKIFAALSNNQPKLAHRLAHTLKSSASLIGAKALCNHARELEALLQNENDLLDLQNNNLLECGLLRSIEFELKLLLDSLAHLLDNKNDFTDKISKDKANPEAVKNFIAELQPLLERSNARSLKYVAELDMLVNEETVTLVGELAEQIESFCSQEAALTLKKITQLLKV